jgi:cyclohexyl-isocyanide hydratase
MTAPQSSTLVTVGMVLFPDLTQLDLTGPYEVFSRMPNTHVHLIAATLAPVRSERGLQIMPDTIFVDVPPLDVVFVPGGVGVNRAMEDEQVVAFVRHHAAHARYVTAVCTGALVLGVAGLLRGYRAATHWLSLDLLPAFGAIPTAERVVIDRNRITGGGITAGIDFGLVVAAELCGEQIAQELQLMLEYDPQPPFAAGSPRTAPADLIARVRDARQDIQDQRRAIVQRAAARLREA